MDAQYHVEIAVDLGEQLVKRGQAIRVKQSHIREAARCEQTLFNAHFIETVGDIDLNVLLE
ncbi:hypothetical protein PPL_02280 [Heterostelium album PN500]|uniref:Uncharacterized protein n=1 Tax=Heterostelium pallidum (strain ATCC 26659 / Pp 5 / PN500) TaxID=670386 RepID=D3B1V5_HETP5|nr:hypothetical protein PPL_02280 [Heterostelium album PN500]EFA85279.1 hypothetical protein PPL_02280 [Heterostelium album PN500]|eukprot:XP_020437388.1 hypothetical protein PPL_02280 [Heterostelium album PN500]